MTSYETGFSAETLTYEAGSTTEGWTGEWMTETTTGGTVATETAESAVTETTPTIGRLSEHRSQGLHFARVLFSG